MACGGGGGGAGVDCGLDVMGVVVDAVAVGAVVGDGECDDGGGGELIDW